MGKVEWEGPACSSPTWILEFETGPLSLPFTHSKSAPLEWRDCILKRAIFIYHRLQLLFFSMFWFIEQDEKTLQNQKISLANPFTITVKRNRKKEWIIHSSFSFWQFSIRSESPESNCELEMPSCFNPAAPQGLLPIFAPHSLKSEDTRDNVNGERQDSTCFPPEFEWAILSSFLTFYWRLETSLSRPHSSTRSLHFMPSPSPVREPREYS